MAFVLAFSAVDFDSPPRVQRNPSSPPIPEDGDGEEHDASGAVSRALGRDSDVRDGIRLRRSQRDEDDDDDD